jgi:FKBP-type peptidyl-prolyl cis-trans isomerase
MKKIVIALLVLTVLILGSYYFLKKTPTQVNQNMNLPQEEKQDINQASPSAQNQTDLKIEDLKIGQGQEIKKGDTAQVHYLGTLTNGQKFDSSYDRNQPFEFQVGAGQVITGWDQGLLGMKIGGKRKLTIPPDLGYGNQAAGSIPPGSTLIFEIELIAIK